VGDCGVLREVLDLLPPGHGYNPYLVRNDDTATGQHVGLLSRIDPIEASGVWWLWWDESRMNAN
jgi:hypothetical protein